MMNPCQHQAAVLEWPALGSKGSKQKFYTDSVKNVKSFEKKSSRKSPTRKTVKSPTVSSQKNQRSRSTKLSTSNTRTNSAESNRNSRSTRNKTSNQHQHTSKNSDNGRKYSDENKALTDVKIEKKHRDGKKNRRIITQDKKNKTIKQ